MNAANLRMLADSEEGEAKHLENFAGDIAGAWDYGSILRVIENLLSNAMKYGKRNAPIVIRLERASDAVRFGVQNQGPPSLNMI